ncbi:phosphoglycerate mutase [Reticulomyxa filosa]|uniref:Phosphoglycerate mutase n=1 Tax=Reticulomyxa filosa TaxID=46433 RepID=X6NLR4_RETFI|nr:phosphoglycerate mutase [Reticulomyxa filosa]|eukprot:ETO26322.1 phosphoglycerate mutase [Reticulomyxa filosa]
MKPWFLKHDYYLVRHAESTANIQHLIVSDLKLGRESYGLTETGNRQAAQCGQQLSNIINKKLNSDDKKSSEIVTILFSPFLRTKQTAQHIYNALTAKDITVQIHLQEEELLRERWFGDVEQTNSKNYNKIWESDIAFGKHHSMYNCESVQSVLERVLTLIETLEKKHVEKKTTFVLVSHGDTCQIAQTWFSDIEPHKHRFLTPIQNAEIRDLTKIAATAFISSKSKL